MEMLIIGFLLGGILGFYCGWVRAHFTVANECKELGGFVVIDEKFTCKKVEKIKEKPSSNEK